MRITLIGPRSVGKSTNAKLLTKKLNLKYISSDEEMHKRLFDLGGIMAAFNPDNKDLFIRRAQDFVNETFKSNDFILDLAGGALYSEDSKGRKLDFSIIKNNSIVIGLLPFKDDKKSIEILKNRENNREHWKHLSEQEILEKTTDHYKKVKKEIINNFENIIYTENMNPKQVVENLMNIIKN